MKFFVLRDESGKVVGSAEAGGIQAAEGIVEVEPLAQEGQKVETVELVGHGTFEVAELHERLLRSDK